MDKELLDKMLAEPGSHHPSTPRRLVPCEIAKLWADWEQQYHQEPDSCLMPIHMRIPDRTDGWKVGSIFDVSGMD